MSLIWPNFPVKGLTNFTSYNQLMSTAARQLIESFEALPESDQREVLVELLRHTFESSYSALSDEELLLAANQVFQELDQREAQG